MVWLAAKARKHALAASTALRHRWAYPADLLGMVLSFGLFIFIFSRLWVTAFEGRATLAGYTQAQLTWYFIVAELLLFGQGGGAFQNLSRDIKSGQIAYTLGRPRAYPLTALAENLAPSLSVIVLLVLVGGVIGAVNAGPWVPVSALQVGVLVLSFVLSLVLNFLCQFCLAMTAFWMEENGAFLWIHFKIALILGTFLPLEFYPAAWRPVLAATPYGWLAYPPSRIAVAFDPGQALALVAGQGLWVALMAGVTAGVYAWGRRRTVLQGG
jgi:ABC-2 type transport system permease protein